jgi:hypothetical protein
MPVTPDFTAYRAWLQNRERSPGTIAKYLRDTARFFAAVLPIKRTITWFYYPAPTN